MPFVFIHKYLCTPKRIRRFHYAIFEKFINFSNKFFAFSVSPRFCNHQRKVFGNTFVYIVDGSILATIALYGLLTVFEFVTATSYDPCD